MACCARHFDLLHNLNLTVSAYAYRFKLFVLASFRRGVSIYQVRSRWN